MRLTFCLKEFLSKQLDMSNDNSKFFSKIERPVKQKTWSLNTHARTKRVQYNIGIPYIRITNHESKSSICSIMLDEI